MTGTQRGHRGGRPRSERPRKRGGRIDLTAMSPRQQEDRVERYCKDRNTAAAHSAGDCDPFVTPRCIERRFKGDGWAVIERLVASKRLVQLSPCDDSDPTEVVHPDACHRRRPKCLPSLKVPRGESYTCCTTCGGRLEPRPDGWVCHDPSCAKHGELQKILL